MRLFSLSAILFICFQSTLFANFSDKSQLLTVDLDAEKFYVQPEDLWITKEGIFLCSRNGKTIPIQSVQSDNSGIFVTFSKDNRRYVTYICPGCGVIYNWWEFCNTPGCPENRPH